jgi:hypothetical protein
VTDREEAEIALLTEVYPRLEAEEYENQQWVLIPDYPVPRGWSIRTPDGAAGAVDRAEICCKIPPQVEAVPYGFAVRPVLALPDGGQIDHYSEPFATPWGSDFGHFSWQKEGGWNPSPDVRSGDNMLDFVRSFAVRLESVE